jgi:thiamine-phosphate pyrophosphorylase
VDRTLLAWGLRPGRGATGRMADVVARRWDERRLLRHDRTTRGTVPRVPRLWLFTDDRRLPDPRTAVAGLPRGRAGVVLRHDADAARAALGRDLARICRARRLVLVVAGDPRLAAALGAGMHLRGGRWPGPLRPRGVVTSSAHGVADIRRAARAGALLAFLSPAFPTASHPGAPGLGPLRWGAMTRRLSPAPTRLSLAALGGVDGGSIRRLPADRCQAVGAISALSPENIS